MADLPIREALQASAKQAAGGAASAGSGPAGRSGARGAPVAELRAAVAQALAGLVPPGAELRFVVDAETERVIVRVVDRETKEVLREIPPAEWTAIRRALEHVQGLLVREKA